MRGAGTGEHLRGAGTGGHLQFSGGLAIFSDGGLAIHIAGGLGLDSPVWGREFLRRRPACVGHERQR